jgi:hypothetical protein
MRRFTVPLFVISVIGLFLSGCFEKNELGPQLAYLVGYSILDDRFHTSTRLDLTADILNQSSQELKFAQLILTTREGRNFTLDYQDIPPFHQEGRYQAIPLKTPIANLEIGGTKGVEFRSPDHLHFLFMDAFESAVIKYRNDKGLHELKVDNLQELIERSRKETIIWMDKEYQEREATLQRLKAEADQRLKKKRK